MFTQVLVSMTRKSHAHNEKKPLTNLLFKGT